MESLFVYETSFLDIVCVCVCVYAQLCPTPQTVACQAPLSMGFSSKGVGPGRTREAMCGWPELWLDAQWHLFQAWKHLLYA